MKARAFSFHEWLATSERKKIIPNESQKPIWIHKSHESQVAKPQVTSDESKWALSDEFGNYFCDFSSA